MRKRCCRHICEGKQPGEIDPDDIRKAIRINTKLIITTHASNVTGTLIPIREIGRIAREHEILYLVDAAQTAGIIPIDLSSLPVDMMAMSGHKGLLWPQGTGVLYIAPHVKLKQLKEGGYRQPIRKPFSSRILTRPL